ncbi:MAG: c-type cytochrome, partial [Litorilinea sp.]
RQARTPVFAAFLLLLALGIAACQPNAQAALISPQLGEQLAAEAAGEQLVLQPTPAPLTFDQLTEEEVYAGVADDGLALLNNANPDNGQNIALANGCVGCHALDPAVQMSGPTWHNVADAASSRVPGQGPANYLWESILQPNAYVVSGYPADVMPQNYGELLSEDDLADMVAYLLTQHGN